MDRSAIEQLVHERGGIKLDIGCGANKQGGFIGLDVRELPGVDIVHDVNVHPWPMPDRCVVLAMASHLVEHIPPVMLTDEGTRFPFIEFMDEAWRIMQPGGEFAIITPHGYSMGFLQDPTHCNACSEATFAYFDPYEPATQGVLWQIYRPKPWRIKEISWSPSANIEVVLVKQEEVANE